MVNYLVDLFCGIGGISEGFKKEGFKVVLAVDLWDKALEVHKKHNKECKHLQLKLGTKASENVLLESFPKLKRDDKLHIHASPPCQNLSSINSRRKEEKGIDMTLWIIDFLTFISENDDRITWSIEQVANSSLVKNIIDYVDDDESPFFIKIYKMQDYGVPQTRQRLIVSNVNLDVFIKPSQPPTLKSLLNVPKETKYIAGACYSYERMKQGTSFAMHKSYDSNTVAYTVVSQPLCFLNSRKKIIRLFTDEESLILQGLPKHYLDGIKLTLQEKRTMIANCVPVYFSRQIARAIKKY